MSPIPRSSSVVRKWVVPFSKFTYLADQELINDREFHRACEIVDWIESVIDSRAGYLARHELSPDVHYPQAIWKHWEGRPLYDAVRVVCSRNRHVLSYLRMWTQHFTGYRLFSMGAASGKGFPDPADVPRAADAGYRSLADRPDVFVTHYRNLTQKLSRELHVSPPCRFGEVGWNVGGRIVNHDTYAYQERIALLHDCGGIDHLRAVAAAGRTPQVLEIGGGYGALVYHLQKLVPQARVVIVDLPESLVFSAVYVSLLRPKLRHVYLAAETPDRELKTVRPGCMFVPNFMFDRLLAAETDFDLVINTLSMSEMAREQVGYYCSGIRKLIGNHGGFFEQNQDNTVIGKLDARRVIADHFAERLVVNSESVSHPLHGSAHVWSNRPWRNAARLPPMALSRVARQSR